MNVKCPTHNRLMLRRATQYGPLYICTFNNCDMMKWGDTSLTTPADTKTRDARHQAHVVFDKLWQDEHMDRSRAYAELAEALDKHTRDTHIGLFDVKECEAVVRFAHCKQRVILSEKFK